MTNVYFDGLRIRYRDEDIVVRYISRRHQYQLKDIALRILRGRLWTEAHGLGRSDAIVQSIEVEAPGPYEGPWPHDDLLSLRRPISPEAPERPQR